MWRHGFGRVHKWLGLTLSLWVVLVSLTGTLLLYKTELLQLQYPELRLAEVPSTADAARVFDRFQAGYAYLPRADKPWIEVVDAEGVTHYFDAAGSAVLARPHLGDWISWFVEFHHHLLLDELGKDLMGIFGLLSLLLVIAGMVRWWPRNWSWRVFSVRWHGPRSRQFRATLWQLHRTSGVLALVPVAVLLLTGTAIMYAATVNSTLTAMFPQTQTRPTAELPTASATNWQQRFAIAERFWPDQKPRLVYLQANAEGAYRMRLKYSDEWHPNGRSYLTFAAQGPLISADDVRNKALGFQLSQLIYPLHVAAVGGIIWLLVTLLGGLVLMLLPVTGVWFWVKRRQRAH
ncbi:PepSY-associated TM helix domain-containing protein [Pseudidiomarina terrestris]|uniref:PepSY domain-containing protein n=1 Tax=Pseudidiomarina terrestris TaxID=2820060 RepID=A0AAW7R4L2_9GAMM|nr:MULTISPECIES: PepSY-associated TM helix domain-containing protein [unclassified Pseudidiomarina]MDN7125620.1 PepSY domain-containing protein [Pseudidiomarina sp. 1APP75-32.1]MDN7126130.1 PepSY domain-containing protein [Pseudidiomarina sp. 1APR75-33.1]MDN7130516.1 PepSY domain-containing protein [Pseudidiomarina sp. 1APR75-15]MDN7134158.1 PepSY domain-containing protein [Pseudidiomarina sp. 1ASP75-5]MDN7137155.1 PepSY domain-containing protein [Pseudidiomarina sp. 1ASP75-14]